MSTATAPRLESFEGIVQVWDTASKTSGQTAKIEAGRVLLPAEAPWLTTFLDEVRAFPSAKYDDQVDSMANFLRHDLRFAQLIKDAGRKWALRSKNPARPGLEPGGTGRLTVIGARRLWEW